MIQDVPAAASPPASPEPGAILLPRPNPGPEPWAGPEVHPGAGHVGWLLGALMAAATLAWGARRLARRRAARRAAAGLPDFFPAGLDPASTPSRRLIASSAAVRAALIAEFGPTWGSRTTEEVARDPAVADRLGPDLAASLLTYLGRVDRAKFADEEPDDVEALIAAVGDLPTRLRASRPPAAGPPPRRSSRAPSAT